MSEESCGNCRFMRDGECHFGPPDFLESHGDIVRGWAEVAEADWCGEWKPGIDLIGEIKECSVDEKMESDALFVFRWSLIILVFLFFIGVLVYQAAASEPCKTRVLDSEYGRFATDGQFYINMDSIILLDVKNWEVFLAGHRRGLAISECVAKAVKQGLEIERKIEYEFTLPDLGLPNEFFIPSQGCKDNPHMCDAPMATGNGEAR